MNGSNEQQTQTEEPKMLPSPVSEVAQLPPAEQAAPAEKPPERQKTEKERVLDELIAKRQAVLDKLKAKNPLVMESRKRISSIIPALRGKGSAHTMDLIRETERIEFSIATEAYTPKKEKELIKRLREIKAELSKHKELDEARKLIESERNNLSTLLTEIKVLEGELAEVRKACDAAYAEVLAERKASYEQRQRAFPQERQREHRHEGSGRHRSHEERKEHIDSDMEKYMKDYDDTVSMEEIVVFEKKERKKEEEKTAEE